MSDITKKAKALLDEAAARAGNDLEEWAQDELSNLLIVTQELVNALEDERAKNRMMIEAEATHHAELRRLITDARGHTFASSRMHVLLSDALAMLPEER